MVQPASQPLGDNRANATLHSGSQLTHSVQSLFVSLRSITYLYSNSLPFLCTSTLPLRHRYHYVIVTTHHHTTPYHTIPYHTIPEMDLDRLLSYGKFMTDRRHPQLLRTDSPSPSPSTEQHPPLAQWTSTTTTVVGIPSADYATSAPATSTTITPRRSSSGSDGGSGGSGGSGSSRTDDMPAAVTTPGAPPADETKQQQQQQPWLTHNVVHQWWDRLRKQYQDLCQLELDGGAVKRMRALHLARQPQPQRPQQSPQHHHAQHHAQPSPTPATRSPTPSQRQDSLRDEEDDGKEVEDNEEDTHVHVNDDVDNTMDVLVVDDMDMVAAAPVPTPRVDSAMDHRDEDDDDDEETVSTARSSSPEPPLAGSHLASTTPLVVAASSSAISFKVNTRDDEELLDDDDNDKENLQQPAPRAHTDTGSGMGSTAVDVTATATATTLTTSRPLTRIQALAAQLKDVPLGGGRMAYGGYGGSMMLPRKRHPLMEPNGASVLADTVHADGSTNKAITTTGTTTDMTASGKKPAPRPVSFHAPGGGGVHASMLPYRLPPLAAAAVAPTLSDTTTTVTTTTNPKQLPQLAGRHQRPRGPANRRAPTLRAPGLLQL